MRDDTRSMDCSYRDHGTSASGGHYTVDVPHPNSHSGSGISYISTMKVQALSVSRCSRDMRISGRTTSVLFLSFIVSLILHGYDDLCTLSLTVFPVKFHFPS